MTFITKDEAREGVARTYGGVLRQVIDRRVRVLLGVGALVVLGACNGERFGSECQAGDCLEMREITDDLVDQADVVWEGGDTPALIPRPASDSRVIFSGALDRDSPLGLLEIEGRAGDLITLQVYSRGLRMPTFSVTHGEDFTRWSPEREEEFGTSRQSMVLPYDGTYLVRIFSHTHEEPMSPPTYTSSEPAGFAGYVEWKSLPSPERLRVGTDFSDYEEVYFAEGEDNVFTIDGIDRGPVGVWAEGHKSDGFTASQLALTLGALSDPSLGSLRYEAMPRQHKAVFRAVVDPTTGHQVHVASETTYGVNSWFRVGAKTLSTLGPGDSVEKETSAKAGQFVVAEHFNWELEPASVELSLNDEVVSAESALPSSGNQAYFHESASLWRYVDDDVEASARLVPAGDKPLYDASLALSAKEPLLVWDATQSTAEFTFEHRELMPAKRSEFVVVETDREIVLVYSVTNNRLGGEWVGSPDIQARLYAIDNPEEPLVDVTQVTNQPETYIKTIDAGRYVLQIEPVDESVSGVDVKLRARLPEY